MTDERGERPDLHQTADPKYAIHLLRSGNPMRRGRKLARTLYVSVGDIDHDVCIGIVDSPELADFICKSVNDHMAEWGDPELDD